MTDSPERPTVAFVCVQNAGRSQMAHAFAERERAAREADVELLTGGTRPADGIHLEVVAAMRAVGIDLSDRTPREVSATELANADYVITMGCSVEEACPAGVGGESRDWDLEDPDGKPPDAVAAIRDEIERRLEVLFDELAGP